MDSNKIDLAILRLRAHADGTESADGSVLADYVWQMKHGQHPDGMNAIRDDIIQTLDVINREFRQNLGHSNGGGSLPRPLVYAISGILGLCLESAANMTSDYAERNSFLEFAWIVNCAWDAAVAGDIDNINDHVIMEINARRVGS